MEKMFRAWDIVKNKWIDGAYGFHILGELMLIGGLFQDYKIEDLNNIIIEQYTGLKDKKRTKEFPKGQEIYEGDIVKFNDNKFGSVVKWNDKGFYQLWRNGIIHWKIWTQDTYFNTGYRKDLEIIGNIHENHKLLEKQE